MNPSNRGRGGNKRFDDDGVYHPYRRHREDIHEASPSTSGAPPIAHMPSRSQSAPVIPDNVPPRAHSMIPPQFSPQMPMGQIYSTASVATPYRHYVPSRPPLQYGVVSSRRAAYGESSRAPNPALPAIEPAPSNRESYEQGPFPSCSGINAPSSTVPDSTVTIGEVKKLIQLFNQQYGRAGNEDDNSSEKPIAACHAQALIYLFNQLQQNSNMVTSTVTSGDSDSSDGFAEGQYAGPMPYPNEASTSPARDNSAYDTQNVYNDEHSTYPTQASTSPARDNSAYDTQNVYNDEHSTYPTQASTSPARDNSAYDTQNVYNDEPSTHPTQASTSPARDNSAYDTQNVYNDEHSTHPTQQSIRTEPFEYEDESEYIAVDQDPANQTPQRENSTARHPADSFGSYLASCLRNMKGKARVYAEKKIFDCLHTIQKDTLMKRDVVTVDSSPESPAANVQPEQENTARQPLMIRNEPEADSCLSPSPIPQLQGPQQQPWPVQQQWSPLQHMQQWQQQQSLQFQNPSQVPVTSIYGQVHPSYMESILWAQQQRPRPPQPGPHNTPFFPLQRMFRPPYSMPRPPYTLPPEFLNQSSDFNSQFDDWDQMFQYGSG